MAEVREGLRRVLDEVLAATRVNVYQGGRLVGTAKGIAPPGYEAEVRAAIVKRVMEHLGRRQR